MHRPRYRFAFALLTVLGLPARLGMAAEPPPSTQATEVAPESVERSLALAREYAAREAVEEAIEAYDTAVRQAPERTDLELEYATYLRKWGFWLRGAARYGAVLKRDPDSLPALLGYGDLLLAQYQFTAAREQFEHVLSLDPPVHVHVWERAMLGLGSAQFGEEDRRGAIATFEAVIDRSPGVFPAYAFLATVRRALGDLDGAEAAWNRLLEIEPDATRAGARRREVQDLKSAIREARALVEASPADPMAWLRLGEKLEEVPQPSEAVTAYAAAAELRPGDAQILYRLGVALREAGRHADAVRAFRRVGDDPVHGIAAAYNLAYCARRAGQPDAEADAWADVVRRVPFDLHAYGRYVETLRDRGRLPVERALVSEQVRALTEVPDAARNVMPWVRLAMLAHAEGEVAEARRAAIEALAIDMNHVNVRRVVRNLFALDTGSVDEALQAMGAPDPGVGRLDPALRGGFLLALGRPADAEPELRRALADGSGDAAVLTVALGSCLRDNGRYEEAVEVLERAAASWPDYAWGHLDLSLARLAAGRPAEAAEAAREAARLHPDSPIPYALLGGALRRLGDLRGAAAALERALALDPLNVTATSRLLLARVYGALDMDARGRHALISDLPREPREMYRTAWEFVRDTYYDRTFHGQDWSAWESRFDGKLTTTADALGAVGLMLSSLDDRNTRLRTPEKTINLFFTPRSQEVEFEESGAAGRSSRTVEAHRLEGNLGYIAITNLDDPKAPREIQKAVENLASADGIILDLRGNQGGSDADVPQIAGMFVPEGVPTGTLIGPAGKAETRAEPPPGHDAPILATDKPVVVLVDRNTGSSAENLAGSLRESGRAVLVGERTFGKAGVQVPLLLSDGTIVLCVAAEHADKQGRVYTGDGLDPDLSVEPGRDATREDAVVGKAREVLQRRKGAPE